MPTILISESLSRKYGLTNRTSIPVRVGSIIVNSKLKIKEGLRNYSLSRSLCQACHLHSYHKLRFRYLADEDMIHLGPVIGILAVSLPNRSRSELEPTSIQAELTYLSHVGRSIKGLVFVFLPSSVNWEQKKVKGYNYKFLGPHHGVWESATYPMPDVVYNRIASRSSELRESVQNTLSKLNTLPYTQVFNPSYLNKWQVYKTLSKNPALLRYIPETMKLTEESLTAMLKKYNVLYLKPSNGSLGRGIIKVKKLANNNLKYTIYARGRINGNVESPAKLLSKTRSTRKENLYIVQQGLELAKYSRSVFDIRIIFQKNGQGQWQIGKKLARIAPGRSSISNLSRGGRATRSSVIMKSLFRKKSIIDAKNAEIKALCEMVASELDREAEGRFGELGLDIGIDKNGRIWLIEANSKPRKTTETEASKVIMRNTFKRPLEYASYLAGFPVKS